MIPTKFYSPHFIGILERLREEVKGFWLAEVQPWFLPHPPSPLTERLQSLLVSEVDDEPEAVMSEEVEPLTTAPHELKLIRAKLEAAEPDDYTGNAYRDLMSRNLLPKDGTWGLVRGVADCTPHDKISNRTRWALQMLFVRYWQKFGTPTLNDSFLYVWHDTAFQFSGKSRTIGKAAWTLMRKTPEWVGEKSAIKAGCAAIYLTNQPDGTIPRIGVPARTMLDVWSRLFAE